MTLELIILSFGCFAVFYKFIHLGRVEEYLWLNWGECILYDVFRIVKKLIWQLTQQNLSY